MARIGSEELAVLVLLPVGDGGIEPLPLAAFEGDQVVDDHIAQRLAIHGAGVEGIDGLADTMIFGMAFWSSAFESSACRT